MAEWREITDRREPVGADRVRLWFELGGRTLRPVTILRAMQSAENIAKIGDTLAAELHAIEPIRVYGDGGREWSP